MSEWFERAKQEPVLHFAEQLGYSLDGHKQTPSSWTLSCPACSAEKRHNKTEARGRRGRGAIGVPKASPCAWHCYQCDAGGDALDFLAYHEHGKRCADAARSPSSLEALRKWCEDYFGLDPGARRDRAQPRRRWPPEPAPAEPTYPPEHEVVALWDACNRVDEDPIVAAWLRDVRKIDPVAIADADAARALPKWFDGCKWMRHKPDADGDIVTWAASNHRLIVPLYDSQGRMRSVIGRSVPPTSGNISGSALRKSTTPNGYQRAALVFACQLARQLLEHGRKPEAWPAGVPLRVLVVEGEVDFATRVADANGRYATIGHFEGGWTQEIADRLPDGARVHVRVHLDKPKHPERDPRGAGEIAATRIVRSLLERAEQGRMTLQIDERCRYDRKLGVIALGRE